MGIEEVLRLLRNKLASLEYSKQQAIETIKKWLDALK